VISTLPGVLAATMQGAGSSHVRLFADSRCQMRPTFPDRGVARAYDIFMMHACAKGH
jgi:hypothetical protein